MTCTEVQERYSTAFGFCLTLPLKFSYNYNVQSEGYFDAYEYRTDIDYYEFREGGLADEVLNNLKTGFSRDAAEFLYLQEFDEFLRGAGDVFDRVLSEDKWRDHINHIVYRVNFPNHKEELSKKPLSYDSLIMVELCQSQINTWVSRTRNICKTLYRDCVLAARNANKSLMVTANPSKFPHITRTSALPEHISRKSAQPDQAPVPAEPGGKDLDMNVKILLAYQSGILNGTFHTLPIEKQYGVLAAIFGRNKASVKNALTALYGDANTVKNPKNLSSVVDKTNDLITEQDLGIPLVIGRPKP